MNVHVQIYFNIFMFVCFCITGHIDLQFLRNCLIGLKMTLCFYRYVWFLCILSRICQCLSLGYHLPKWFSVLLGFLTEIPQCLMKLSIFPSAVYLLAGGADVQIFSPLASGISCCSEGSYVSGIQIFIKYMICKYFLPRTW